MPTTIHTDISIERVVELIESYGSNTQCWPEQERAAAIACLKSSASLQQRMDEAKQLDAMLLESHAHEPLDEVLLTRIVNNLPAQPVAKQTKGLPRWPVAMAAALTAVAITLVVVSGLDQTIPTEQLALQEIDYWLWQEVTDQVAFDTGEETPTDFMSLL